MISLSKRRLLRGVAVIAAAACLVGVAASVAAGGPPGNNGTVKIDFDTGPITRANHPHPGCPFRISGFGFDASQAVDFIIEPQGGPNVAGSGTLSDAFSADAQGTFVEGPYDGLAAGMYKLDLRTHEPGGHKYKVFRVECPAPPPVTPTTPVTPGAANVTPRPAAAAATTQVVQGQPRTTG